MSRISPNVIANIVTNKNVTDLFLEFDKYKDYFSEGTNEEYYEEICAYLMDYVNYKDLSLDVSRNKNLVGNIIRILESRLATGKISKKGLLTDDLVDFLYQYENRVIIDSKLSSGYASFDNKDREKAMEITNSNWTMTRDFFYNSGYTESFLEALDEYKEYLDSDNFMERRKFGKLEKLLSKAASFIPIEYVNLYFREIIKRNRKSNKEAIKRCTYSLISKSALKYSNNNPSVDFVPTMDYASGTFGDGVIEISGSLLDTFATFPKKYAEEYFETCFHELAHFRQQEKFVANGNMKYGTIRMLKDHLLFMACNKRYKRNNYMNFTFEVDARVISRIYADRYLKALGIPKTGRNVKKINATDIRKNTRTNRLVENKLVPVDHLFEEFIPNIINIFEGDFGVNIFDTYPVLGLMYDREGKRYTTLDLFKSREQALAEADLASSKDAKQELESKAYVINEILYNQDLSYVNLVADYKQLVNDSSLKIDPKEKGAYLDMMYKKSKDSKVLRDFRDLSYFVGQFLSRKVDDVSKEIESTIKTGSQMMDIFRDMLLQKNNPQLLKKQ